jgi:hypothetical protein
MQSSKLKNDNKENKECLMSAHKERTAAMKNVPPSIIVNTRRMSLSAAAAAGARRRQMV